MAKLRPILGELSGSIGNNTFAHNRGGAYARRRTQGVNTTSITQTLARNQLTTLSRRWQTLSTAKRQAWTDWATLNPTIDSLGTPNALSGQQAYVQLNARILRVQIAPVDTPPVNPNPTAQNITTVVVTAPNSVVITAAVTPLPADVRLWVKISGGHSAGRAPNIRTTGQVRWSNPAAASPISISSISTHQWIAGQTVTVWVATMDANGRLSPFQRFDRISL